MIYTMIIINDIYNITNNIYNDNYKKEILREKQILF